MLKSFYRMSVYIGQALCYQLTLSQKACILLCRTGETVGIFAGAALLRKQYICCRYPQTRSTIPQMACARDILSESSSGPRTFKGKRLRSAARNCSVPMTCRSLYVLIFKITLVNRYRIYPNGRRLFGYIRF